MSVLCENSDQLNFTLNLNIFFETEEKNFYKSSELSSILKGQIVREFFCCITLSDSGVIRNPPTRLDRKYN